MPTMRERIAELDKKRADTLLLGGEDKIQKQHERGKLTCRERIDLLLDPGSFMEFGRLGYHHGDSKARSPADGCVTGYGTVNGRKVAVAAYDFTVFGGSIGEVSENKMARLREMVLRWRIPIVWLIDSAGARIGGGSHDREASRFAGTGFLFQEQAVLSGVVPQVCAMVGPGAAGTAYIPGLADFVPMVKGTSSMALAGPYLVKAAVGEDVSEQDLGGSQIHTEISGVGDLETASDQECIEKIKQYLSYFPSNCEEKPPVVPYTGKDGLIEDKILDVIPDNPKRAYDVHKVIGFIADEGSFFEMKPKWARNICTGFARFGGRPAGIVASNPMFLGGALDVNAADKAAHFVWLCDAFSIPLVFLQDTPGFVVGSKVEQQGIIRHGAKMLHAVATATVPKVTILLRKCYGAGYYVMNGAAYEPDAILAWPLAEISVMGPEGMVAIFARKMLEAMPEAQRPDAAKQMADKIRETIDPYVAAGWAMVDDVIDPRETRQRIIQALFFSESKRMLRPYRKHGVYPV